MPKCLNKWLQLFKIVHAAEENLLVLLASNIAEEAGSKALAVAHLAQDAAIGASDAFDSVQAAIRVERSVHRGHACSIYILSSYLAIRKELLNRCFRCVEATFAVGNSNSMLLAGLAQAEPRRLVRNNASGHDLGNVATNIVEGQGRRSASHIANLAIGHQTQLDQSLEAVANAQHQAVAILQQIADSSLDARIAEHSSNELATAVRLVASTEATGNHHDLGIVDIFNHCFHGFFNGSSGQIANNKGLGLGTGSLESTGTVIFTVVAWEDGNEYAGLVNIHRSSQSQSGGVQRRPLSGASGVFLSSSDLWAFL